MPKQRIDYYQQHTQSFIALREQGLSATEIAHKYNANLGTICIILRAAGYNAKRIDWGIVVPQVKTLYETGINGPEISKQLDLSLDTVFRALRRGRVKLRSSTDSRCKSGIRHDYFTEIDTATKAYILGFTMADGYNSQGKTTVRYGLAPKDRCILEFIKSELQTNSRIRTYAGYDYLSLYSKQISDDLARHGAMQNKTHKLKFPTTVPEHLISAFMLGYFDGDGCFSVENFSVVGAQDFLVEYQLRLMKMASLSQTKFSVRHKRSPNICAMTYGGSNVVARIHKALYNEENKNLCLHRKLHKMEEYLIKKGKL